MPLTVIGFWLMYIAGIGSALATPLAGVLLYILVYHMNPEQQWWGGSVRELGMRTSMTIVIAIVIGLVLRRPRFDGGGRQFSVPIVWALLLTALAIASQTWGYGFSERGVQLAEKLVKVMIFLVILIRCVQRPQHYHLVIAAWVCGVLYVGYQAFGNVGVYGDGRLAIGVGGSDFSESGDLATHLIASLPLIGAMFFMARRWWSRGLLLITGALAVNTIILTRTRSAIVALAAMCVVAGCSLPRGYRLKGWTAIVAGCVLAIQLTDPGWWDRMGTTFTYTDSSATARVTYWHAAVAMAADYPFGIGIGNFHEVVKEYVPGLAVVCSAHSTYFECLAELGYAGLILLILVLLSTLWRLTRVCRQAPRLEPGSLIDIGRWQVGFHLGWHAMALRTALVGYLTSAAFTTRLFGENLWLLIGLAACLDNVRAHLQCRRLERSHTNAPAVSRFVPDEPLALPAGSP